MSQLEDRINLLAGRLGLTHLMRRTARCGVTILMYHRVLPDDVAAKYPFGNLVIRASHFREHLLWLSTWANLIPIREAMPVLRGEQSLDDPRPIVCMSFDDGYWDNAEVAWPMMRQFDARGTFFVTTDLIEGEPMWFDLAATIWHEHRHVMQQLGLSDLPPRAHEHFDSWMGFLKNLDADPRQNILARAQQLTPVKLDPQLYGPMTRDALHQMHLAGQEIASHTVSHPMLDQLDDGALQHELHQSRDTLQHMMDDASVVGLCYPNGRYDARVRGAAAQAGYHYACTTQRGFNRRNTEPLTLHRRYITEANTTDRFGQFSAHALGAVVFGVRDAVRRLLGR